MGQVTNVSSALASVQEAQKRMQDRLAQTQAASTTRLSSFDVSSFEVSSFDSRFSAGTESLNKIKEALSQVTLLSADGMSDDVKKAMDTKLSEIRDAVGGLGQTVAGIGGEYVSALSSGLGSMVDADLATESARLQALQTQQQLGTQALSIANQAPQSLIALFR